MTISAMKKLIWMLCAAALAAAVAVLACLLVGEKPRPAHSRVAGPPPGGTSPAGKRRDIDDYVRPITAREPENEKPAVPAEAAPGGPGGIFRLVSVFLVEGEKGTRGFAAIVYGKEETLYSEGALLPEAYMLERIRPESVLLEKGGRLWSLDLTGHAEAVEITEAEIEETEPADAKVLLDIAGAKILKPKPFTDSSGAPGERYRIPRKDAKHILENLHKLIHDVEIKFDISGANGEMVGVRIRPKEGSVPHRLGLRDGDVIRAVDGKLLKSMADVMAVFRKYRKKPPEISRILVERDGKVRVWELILEGAKRLGSR